MRPFRYLTDPLFLISCTAYAFNRWFLKEHVSSPFLEGHFNDLLLIPAALPPVLWLQRQLKLRSHDHAPSLAEILVHLAIWSLICEGIGPLLVRHATADWLDVACYLAGGAIAFILWVRMYQPGFDSLASCYDLMEELLAGKRLALCRTAYLGRIPPPEKALILGEGHGRFLDRLLTTYPETRVTCIEQSTQMIGISRKRLESKNLSLSNIRFIHGDARGWQPGANDHYDLIVTHFFLDCFPAHELETLIPKIANCGKPGSRWLLSDFHEPTYGKLRRLRAQSILWLMYRFFRLATAIPARDLTDPLPLLEKSGFKMEERKEFEYGLLYTLLLRQGLGGQAQPSADI